MDKKTFPRVQKLIVEEVKHFAVELLQDKFKATGFDNVTDWMKDCHVDLSLQACTAILLRNKEMGIISMLTLAIALNCSDEEIVWIAKSKGDTTLWRLFVKKQISVDEQRIIDDYRQLSTSQQKAVKAMLKGMMS